MSAAVEEAANAPFFAFMRTQVFEPLGMRDTTIDVATEAIPARASFYWPRFGLVGDTRYGPKSARQGDHSCYAGAGAFLSTPSDLVRFGMAAPYTVLTQLRSIGFSGDGHRASATLPRARSCASQRFGLGTC